MTIKWVKSDPLVMNGEPFCYGSRLTVRQLLELRRAGYTLTDLLTDHPELRTMGIASAYAFAAGAGIVAFDPPRRATELAILDALRAVVDPEIGMNVVELALICGPT